MKKLFLAFYIATFAVAFSSHAQVLANGEADTGDANTGKKLVQTESPEAVAKRLQWWSDARFGMFIHWGLYSQWGCHYPGTNGELLNGGSEHMMQHLKIPLKEYAKIADIFNPTNFNADEWVSIAKNAGMKYIVLTTKHHDGFAMFNSPSSDYNIVKMTPWHRDPTRELADACAKQGLKFGVYYSLGRDWQDPDCPTRDGYRSNTWDYTNENAKVFSRYFKRKVVPQITELMTQYHPALIWFDTPEEISKAESEELVALIHKLQPDCIINSRVGNRLGDYGVQEQKIPGSGDTQPWETCMTLNGHWGYFLGDENWKSPTNVIHNLVDIISKGGNYLLNVGPTGQGIIPQGAVKDLDAVGAWMKVNGEAIYGTSASPTTNTPSWGRITKKITFTAYNGSVKPNSMPSVQTNLYLHVFNWPKDGKLVLNELVHQPYAYFLADPKKQQLPLHEVTFNAMTTATNLFKSSSSGDTTTIDLPPKPLDPIDTVIVLQM